MITGHQHDWSKRVGGTVRCECGAVVTDLELDAAGADKKTWPQVASKIQAERDRKDGARRW